MLRRADAADVPLLRPLVERAFDRYVERIGRRPSPMDDDYAALVDARRVVVADDDGIAGLVVLLPAADHLHVETVAVDPRHQGRGLGRALLEHAEACARELGVGEVRLSTNVAMTENLALYPRLGHREVGRSEVRGFSRVHFAKTVAGGPDLDALLARIGLAERPAADLTGLRTVHRAYLEHVPYETLAIHLGEVVPLDLERLAERVLSGGRGGYCFELNGLLGWLLAALGFGVERREARVGARDGDGPTNHLSLVVRVPGEDGRWLADAGLGEGWIDPIALVPGVQAGPGRLGWTLERLPGAWWIGQHPWGSFSGVEMRDGIVGLDAFAPHHRRLSCDPASSFMAALVVQRPLDDRILTLRARTLSARGPQVDERRLLADRDDLGATLQGTFGIDPTALGGERLDRLWTRVAAQHEAWLAG